MGGLSSMMKGGGMPGFPGMGPQKGFRQEAGSMPQLPGAKQKKKGTKGPWGKGYFQQAIVRNFCID